jgi:hypothetical protein
VVAVSERSVALTTTYEYLVDGRLSDQAREVFGVVHRAGDDRFSRTLWSAVRAPWPRGQTGPGARRPRFSAERRHVSGGVDR